MCHLSYTVQGDVNADYVAMGLVSIKNLFRLGHEKTVCDAWLAMSLRHVGEGVRVFKTWHKIKTKLKNSK